MIPLPAIAPLLGSLWSQSKWVIILAILGFTHYSAMEYGAKRELRKMVESESAQVQKAKDDGKKGVVRAASDVARIKDLEKENAELERKFTEGSNRTVCVPNDDELRVLREISESTK